MEQPHRTTELSGNKPREAHENGTSSVLGSSGKRLKVNAAQAVNIKKAGKRNMEEMTGGEIFRLIQYLRAQGWTDEKIVKLIEFITR